MPQLIGTPMRPVTPMAVAGSFARLCINRELRLFAAHQSSPVVDWLRALARDAHAQCGGPGVGAIGMCLTGNFALSMMLDAPVLAPVLAQPSLPVAVTARHGRGAARPRRRRSPPRTTRSIITAPAFWACGFRAIRTARRRGFNTLRAEFGEAFESIELDARHAKPDEMKPAHSMLTTHLIDAAGEPTRAALDRTLRFFAEQLKP